jgi:zinc D-Ala-D-Ala dipeptidase
MRPYVTGVRMSLARRLMVPRLRGAWRRVDTDNRTLGNVRVLTLCAVTAIAALAAPLAQAQAPRGKLDFRRVVTSPYIEGSVSFLRVRDASGALVVDERTGPRLRWRVRRRLPAGRYRLTSFERPCVGNCSLLDPPTDRCSARVTIIAHGRTGVRATVRPFRGCRIRSRARPALFPPPERVRAARRFLSHRAGIVSWALIDSHGRTHGLSARRTFISASLVKAMLLVAYLRQVGNRPPTAAERALLGPMITRSDNRLATAVFARVGDLRLRALAARGGMKSFSVSGYWSGAHFSATDQARFFRVFDRLVPKRSRGYARQLLSSIVAWQRWGFSRSSLAAGFHTFFKGGWRRTGLGLLVHEAALFERGPLRVSMAVLSDGNPSHDYGTATLRGVAQRIFGRRDAAAAVRDLVDIQRFAPGIRVELAYATRDNLTGRRLPGYCENRAFLLPHAARSLARVQRYLRRRDLGLLVRDAYRPARASRALVRWAERSGRGHLVGSYIARRSRHNTGGAVDLTLVRADSGRPLEMGTGYDDLSSRAHTRNARGRALRNRLILERAMQRFGFEPYWREWWHFEHRRSGNRYLDEPIGCRD